MDNTVIDDTKTPIDRWKDWRVAEGWKDWQVADRWKVTLPSHPEVTFDDLRAGRWPKPTDDEIKARRAAIELAHQVRAELDIRPLTTSTIIRQIRIGKTTKRR